MEIFSSLDLMFNMRIGFSKDIHKFKKGCKLILGGVEIPYEFGLESHSDGDVVLHAVAESILGAINAGDLGTLFPDNDDKYRGISSSYFVKEADRLMKEKGYFIENIDIFISCEAPKLAPYKTKMAENIAKLLQIDADKVSVKAGTNEGLGPVGEKKAIEAYSIVLLSK